MNKTRDTVILVLAAVTINRSRVEYRGTVDQSSEKDQDGKESMGD